MNRKALTRPAQAVSPWTAFLERTLEPVDIEPAMTRDEEIWADREWWAAQVWRAQSASQRFAIALMIADRKERA